MENQNPVATQENNSIEGFISQAIKSNVPIETLERLLAMRDKIKAEKAKEAFDTAMALFQGECPIIEKNKHVSANSGKVAYSYAPIETIVEQVKDLLQKHGFSYAIKTETGDTKVKSTCIAKHKAGHSEPSSMEVPLGTKTGIMSDTQVVAAASTFAKRYAFCNAFGIMTGDEDIDAVEVKEAPKPISTKAQILHLLTVLGAETKDKEAIKTAIKKFTFIEATEDQTVLEEIRNRLEALVKEKQHANA